MLSLQGYICILWKQIHGPTPFPSSPPRGARLRAVSRERQAGLVVHRRLHLPGRQLEVLPRRPWQHRAEPGALTVFLRHLVPGSLQERGCRQAEQPGFQQHTQASRAVFSQTLPATFSGACRSCRCTTPLEIQHQSWQRVLKIQRVKPSSERAQDVKGSGAYSPHPHASWEVTEILRNKSPGKQN